MHLKGVCIIATKYGVTLQGSNQNVCETHNFRGGLKLCKIWSVQEAVENTTYLVVLLRSCYLELYSDVVAAQYIGGAPPSFSYPYATYTLAKFSYLLHSLDLTHAEVHSAILCLYRVHIHNTNLSI